MNKLVSKYASKQASKPSFFFKIYKKYDGHFLIIWPCDPFQIMHSLLDYGIWDSLPTDTSYPTRPKAAFPFIQ